MLVAVEVEVCVGGGTEIRLLGKSVSKVRQLAWRRISTLMPYSAAILSSVSPGNTSRESQPAGVSLQAEEGCAGVSVGVGDRVGVKVASPGFGVATSGAAVWDGVGSIARCTPPSVRAMSTLPKTRVMEKRAVNIPRAT